MLKELKKQVLEANLLLEKYHLVTFTWGNVSGIDRERGLIVIKPSGVPYEELLEEHMVVLDLEGKCIEGALRPSSDTPTHLELYKAFEGIGAVVHTHSSWATAWAQSGRFIPAYGTTHCDYFYGDIPCTRGLFKREVEGEYEKETGLVIIEAFKDLDPLSIPAVLVKNHGPFTWGGNPKDAVHNAVVLEESAKMAYHTMMLNPEAQGADSYLLDRHFLRKHGPEAYYGQK